MSEDERIATIIAAINDIETSDLPVRVYFEKFPVPFTRPHYYIYRKILRKYGEEGLRDKRTNGNNTKLTQRLKDYVISTVTDNREISSIQLQTKILNQFGVRISESSLNSFRASVSLSRLPVSSQQRRREQRSGGGEIITALAYFTHIIDIYTQTIISRIDEIRDSPAFQAGDHIPPDNIEYRNHGKFTHEYNQLIEVRENRFKSIENKIPSKNFSSMRIFSMSEETIFRYNMALLCLPLVTSNGRTSRVNRVKGNDLEFLCGKNYKDASIIRYLQELKYIQISDRLITATAKFWQEFWFRESGEETIFLCYYIDGNTKPLWSSNRCYKGKVTMLGRVMNCLENVFIHDGKGHPLYFQTFQGHGDLGKQAMSMLSTLTQLLDCPESQVSIKRILVFDGGGNGVKNLRSFHDSDDYYITILDDNQVNERKIKHVQQETRYQHGNANLFDCQIELKDSSEKDYLLECRAINIEWDNGKQSVLVTNIPYELLDASEVTKKYFDRWPYQEKQFRDAKSGVNIHRIVGYGMKIENYDRMEERHGKLCETISRLQLKLAKPLDEIRQLDENLMPLYARERILHEKSEIIDGKRIIALEDSTELQDIETQIKRYYRQKKVIESEYKEDFKRLKNCLKEERSTRNKDKVYKIDVELDQIMTCFKMSFVNLCSLFLTKCMDNQRFELLTLFESIFQLNGISLIEGEKKCIQLERNTKEPELMNMLKIGLQKLGDMNIIDTEGKAIYLSV